MKRAVKIGIGCDSSETHLECTEIGGGIKRKCKLEWNLELNLEKPSCYYKKEIFDEKSSRMRWKIYEKFRVKYYLVQERELWARHVCVIVLQG